MKTIKSAKWYRAQIAARENAADNLTRMIDDPWNPTPERLILAARHNREIQADCRALYGEINELKAEHHLYYGR